MYYDELINKVAIACIIVSGIAFISGIIVGKYFL